VVREPLEGFRGQNGGRVTQFGPRFQPSYGAVSATAISQLVSVGIQAGTAIASTAIAASARKKTTASQQAHERKMAVLEQKRAELEAQTAAAQERAAAKTTKSKTEAPAPQAVPSWAIGLGALAILGLGGILLYKPGKKPATATAQGA